jgi:hypothetical protein
MSTWHLSIDYDEGVADSYRAICVKSDAGEKRFETGNPQEDWAAYLDWAKETGALVLESSSVTHFCFDNPEWRFTAGEDGREILVPEDRPEWLNEI